jgi:hypothetical protein
MSIGLSFKYLVVRWFVVIIILGGYDFRDWNRGFDGLGGSLLNSIIFCAQIDKRKKHEYE